jgi:hypothetical protein
MLKVVVIAFGMERRASALRKAANANGALAPGIFIPASRNLEVGGA